jgi:hypothetical protein
MSSGPTGSRAQLTIVKEKNKFKLYRFGAIVASSDSEEKLKGIFGYYKKSPFKNDFDYEENSNQAEDLQ